MRAVYIESCALFVRGGVYRIVKEALGGFWAKAAVSALLFDYVLTGPISGVSAGQYIVGLVLEMAGHFGMPVGDAMREIIKSGGSVAIACAVTIYFLNQNLIGIHESSGKALKIMMATTVMGVVMLTWSGVTLAVRGPVNDIPSWKPDLQQESRDCRGWQNHPDARSDHRRTTGPARNAGQVSENSRANSQPAELAEHRRSRWNPHRLWAFDSGDERRGNAGTSLSRG